MPMIRKAPGFSKRKQPGPPKRIPKGNVSNKFYTKFRKRKKGKGK